MHVPEAQASAPQVVEPASVAPGGLPGSAAVRRIEDVAGIGLLGTMVVTVSVQVVVRFALYRVLSLPWIDELSRILLVWLTFLGAAIVFRDADHVTLDLLYEHLPARLQRVASVVTTLTLMAVIAVLLWVGWPLLQGTLGRNLPATGLPRLVLEAALWVPSALMAFHLVEHVVAGLRSDIRQRPGAGT